MQAYATEIFLYTYFQFRSDFVPHVSFSRLASTMAGRCFIKTFDRFPFLSDLLVAVVYKISSSLSLQMNRLSSMEVLLTNEKSTLTIGHGCVFPICCHFERGVSL